MALFDVSAADHSILLKRLSVSFGLTDKPQAYLLSFLTDRTQCVVDLSGSSPGC